jgi:hypothetical protein
MKSKENNHSRRARCGETCTAGSVGGGWKRAVGNAPCSYPTTLNLTFTLSNPSSFKKTVYEPGRLVEVRCKDITLALEVFGPTDDTLGAVEQAHRSHSPDKRPLG